MFLGQKTAMLSLFQLSIYLQLILYGLGHVTWHNNGYTKLFFFMSQPAADCSHVFPVTDNSVLRHLN